MFYTVVAAFGYVFLYVA